MVQNGLVVVVVVVVVVQNVDLPMACGAGTTGRGLGGTESSRARRMVLLEPRGERRMVR